MSETGRNRHGSSDNVRSAVTALFAFVLSVSLLAFGAFTAAKIVMSESFFTSALDDRYFSLLYRQICDDASDYTIPVGLPDSVLDGVFSEEQIRKDVLETLAAAYKGEEPSVDVSHLEEKLTANVAAFFRTQEVEIGTDSDANISAYVEEIGMIYTERVEMPGINLIVKASQKVDRIIYIGWAVSLLAAGIMLFLCLKTQRFLHRGLRYVAYALGGASLMSLSAPLVVLLRRAYERIQLNPEFFYHFAVSYVRKSLFLCLVVAAVWFAIMLAVIAVVVILRKRAEAGSEHLKKTP